MERFKIETLDHWHLIECGKVYTYPTTGNSRSVKVTFFATDKVIVWASSDPDFEKPVPVASGEGLFSLDVNVASDLLVKVQGSSKTTVVVRDHARRQAYIPSEGAESFLETDITPAPVAGSYEQIIRAVNAQNDARFQKMRAEIDRLQKKAVD